MLVGYARGSTQDQTLALQQDALYGAGCERIFTDTASGARADRLGRSLPHLIETVRGLEQSGIGFRSLTEQIDTTTSGGKLIFHVFAALAEFERDVIRERIQAGLAAARARGRRPQQRQQGSAGPTNQA